MIESWLIALAFVSASVALVLAIATELHERDAARRDARYRNPRQKS